MSPRPRRDEQNNNLQETIKETAWQQIAESGASGLSLRAIARALNITAPAIYNYYPDRDALVTALIVDAYREFGDYQIAAIQNLPEDDFSGRMLASGLAYRQWAHQFPQRYQLIFGTPIPGYKAPYEVVMPVAARSISVLVNQVEAIRKAGRLKVDHFPEVMPEYRPAYEAWKEASGHNANILSLGVAVLIWARVHGIVSLEIANNLPPFGATGDGLYRYEMDLIEKDFIEP